jgi:hypothetical protein
MRDERPLFACYPRDVISQVADYAAFTGREPELSDEMLDWAWNNYFASHGAAASGALPRP